MTKNLVTSNILIYQTEDGKTKIATTLEDDTVWLTIRANVRAFSKKPFYY